MTGPPPSTDREALIIALAEQAQSGVLKEPDQEPEELLDYLEGRLAPEEARRIERLLVAYPETAREFLDLAAERSDVLAELEAAGASAGERPAEIATVAGWRDFRGRLEPIPSSLPQKRLAPLLPAIAASLLTATVGLGYWALRPPTALHRPIANLVSLELPSGRRADNVPAAVVPPGEPLRVVLAPAERCPGYTAEVEGPGMERQTVAGLTRDEGGLVTFLLPRTEPGLYSLRLLGCEPPRTLEEQRFRVTRTRDG